MAEWNVKCTFSVFIISVKTLMFAIFNASAKKVYVSFIEKSTDTIVSDGKLSCKWQLKNNTVTFSYLSEPFIFIYFTFEFIVSSKQILAVEGKLFRNASMLYSTPSLRECDTQQFPLHRRNLFLICPYLSIVTP